MQIHYHSSITLIPIPIISDPLQWPTVYMPKVGFCCTLCRPITAYLLLLQHLTDRVLLMEHVFQEYADLFVESDVSGYQGLSSWCSLWNQHYWAKPQGLTPNNHTFRYYLPWATSKKTHFQNTSLTHFRACVHTRHWWDVLIWSWSMSCDNLRNSGIHHYQTGAFFGHGLRKKFKNGA